MLLRTPFSDEVRFDAEQDWDGLAIAELEDLAGLLWR